jgi:hypothetical protein
MSEKTPLQILFDTLPQTGRVEWIGIRPARGKAMEALDSVAVTPGKGLEGVATLSVLNQYIVHIHV